VRLAHEREQQRNAAEQRVRVARVAVTVADADVVAARRQEAELARLREELRERVQQTSREVTELDAEFWRVQGAARTEVEERRRAHRSVLAETQERLGETERALTGAQTRLREAERAQTGAQARLREAERALEAF